MMKTHDIARILRSLANFLEHGPNTHIEDAQITSKDTSLSRTQIAVSLDTLMELSRVDKRQWTAFVQDMGFNLEIRPRDASRDILGKLLNYLDANPIARDTLKTKANLKNSDASPELMRALSSLLKG